MSVLTAKAQPVLRPIRNSPQGEIINSGSANNRFADKMTAASPSAKPLSPYKPYTLASQGKLAPDVKLVRFYSPTDPNAPTNQQGGFACPVSEVKGLTPQQIQDKFALPNVPTMMTDVDAVGAEIRVGTAGPNFGGAGGGIQVEFVSQVRFINPRPIGAF